jgi:hypothetical protein
VKGSGSDEAVTATKCGKSQQPAPSTNAVTAWCFFVLVVLFDPRAAEKNPRGVGMNSAMIGKIEKAHRYAEEPDRIQFQSFTATFRGGHDDYQVAFDGEHWTCSCHTFESHTVGTCSHIMAMQQILAPMLSSDARYASELQPA